MANTTRNERPRRPAGVSVDGNTARRLPASEPAQNSGRPPQNRKKTRRTPRKSRTMEPEMNGGFLLFLTVICAAVLFTGVQFLKMKSEVTARTRTIADLESDLSTLRADNDAYYSQVAASEDLEAIKKKAVNELGMKYPSEQQTVTYQKKRSSYVRQYQDVTNSKQVN